MAIPELLVATSFTSTLQVGELVGGSMFNQIGANVTTTCNEIVTLNQADVTNRVVEHKGKIFVIFNDSVTGLEVQEYDPGTGLWTQSDVIAASFPHCGIWTFNTGSTERIIYWYQHSTFIIHGRYSDDGGTTWISFDTGVSSGNNLFRDVPAVAFGDKLYLSRFYNGGRDIYVFDPLALSTSVITTTIANNQNVGTSDICVFDDRLFMLSPDASPGSADWALYEIVGGASVLNTQITNDNRLTVGNCWRGQCALFEDPTAGTLIAICNGQGVTMPDTQGSTAFELTPSGGTFSVSDVTSVIPAGFGPGERGATNNATEDRWYPYVSNATPGSTEIYLFFAAGPSPGASYAVYQWTNSMTQLAAPASGPTFVYSFPHTKVGGGDRVNRGSGNQCMIESTSPVLGGLQISYRVFGTQTNQDVRVYIDAEQGAPATQATLTGAATGGGTRVGNEVQGVTGDDGVTLHTLIVDVVGSGLALGDTITLGLDIRP